MSQLVHQYSTQTEQFIPFLDSNLGHFVDEAPLKELDNSFIVLL